MEQKRKDKKEATYNHYHNGSVLPRVCISYNDSTVSLTIDSTAYSYDDAYNGALTILDSRFRDLPNSQRKDNSIG